MPAPWGPALHCLWLEPRGHRGGAGKPEGLSPHRLQEGTQGSRRAIGSDGRGKEGGGSWNAPRAGMAVKIRPHHDAHALVILP